MHLSSNACEVNMHRRVICIDQISIFIKENIARIANAVQYCSVTLNCQETKTVKNLVSQLSE